MPEKVVRINNHHKFSLTVKYFFIADLKVAVEFLRCFGDLIPKIVINFRLDFNWPSNDPIITIKV